MAGAFLAGAAACRKRGGELQWLVVQVGRDGWELPKIEVRRGESSVQAVIRSMSEEIGVRAHVLEEAGRATVSASSNGEEFNQKVVFYLILQRPGEAFEGQREKTKWFPYAQAKKNLRLEREKRILRQANVALKEWQKANPNL